MNREPFPSNLSDDELRRYLRSLEARVVAAEAMYVERTLAADLNSGNTVVNSGVTLNAKFIRSGYKFASGTAVGAIWNGTDYSIIVGNACETT